MKIAEIFRSLQGEGRLTGVDSVFVRASGCNLRCGYCDTPYASWSPEGEVLSVDEILDQMNVILSKANVILSKANVILSKAKNPQSHQPSAVSYQPIDDSLQPTAYSLKPTAYSLQPTASPKHVVLTGGEPMLFAELIPLSTSLHNDGWHITIETSGTLYLPVVCDLMSISPKLSNSTPCATAGLSSSVMQTPGATGSASASTCATTMLRMVPGLSSSLVQPPMECDPRWTCRHEANRNRPEVINRLISEYDYQIKFVIDTPSDCEEAETYLASMPQIDRARVMLMPQGTDPAELAQKNQWLEPYCDEHGFIFCPRRHIEWFGPGRGK